MCPRRAQAKLGAVVASSFMLGPAIGAGLGELGLNIPMFLASGVSGERIGGDGILLVMITFHS